MPDPAAAPVVETPAPAPANGTSNGKPAAAAPAVPAGLADALKALSALPPEKLAEVGKFVDGIVNPKPAAEAKAPEAPKEAPPDPHPMPDGLVGLPTKSFQWVPECWRNDTYVHNGETFYRAALHGLFIAVDTRPAVPVLAIALWEPLRVLDRRGKIIEAAPEGSIVLVDVTPSLLTLADMDVSAGCPHIAIRPTRFTTSTSGAETWFFDVQVEPDARNPNLPKLYSKESALRKRGVRR